MSYYLDDVQIEALEFTLKITIRHLKYVKENWKQFFETFDEAQRFIFDSFNKTDIIADMLPIKENELVSEVKEPLDLYKEWMENK